MAIWLRVMTSVMKAITHFVQAVHGQRGFQIVWMAEPCSCLPAIRRLKPAYLADVDKSRALLAQRGLCDLLGFDTDTYDAVRRLAAKWCAEPSVHGGKKRLANTG